MMGWRTRNPRPFRTAERQLSDPIVVTGSSTLIEVIGTGTNSNDRIENIIIQDLQTIGGNDVIDGKWSGRYVDAGAGNDNITLSKTVDALSTASIINTGAGDDTLNLTIVPQGFESSFESSSLYEVNLDSGSDSLTVRLTEPIVNDLMPIVRNSRIVANGEVGGKTIDLPFNDNYASSRIDLTIEASDLRKLFALDPEAEIGRLFIDVADSQLKYTLNNTNPETATKTDEIIQADRVILDLSDPNLPVTIQVDPQDFNASYLNIDAGNSSVTEIVLDGSNVTDIPNSVILDVNGEYTVVRIDALDDTAFDYLQRNLIGEFKAIDFSSLEGGANITSNFLTAFNASELDVFELIFGDEADTIIFAPDSSFVSSVGTSFEQRQRGIERLMSFELGAGDDIFHDRPGIYDSEIYPDSGSDFVYGSGGYDTVHYQTGSRLDYEITVIDERTVEVYYRPEDTTDTLIDVEEIDFDGADDPIFNPYWQGPDIVGDSSYTTFTLQVFAENNWNQPPFVYAPWTNLVPKGITEITLTREFLFSNIVDPEGDEAELEISFFDVYATDDSINFEIDTTDENADSYQVTIPSGLNDEEQAIVRLM